MRKLIVAAFISLDGVMQALFSQPFELLLGRRTYDIFAGYWPKIKDDSEDFSIANLFNRVPKHVATHTPATLDWRNSHALGTDVTATVRAGEVQTGSF